VAEVKYLGRLRSLTGIARERLVAGSIGELIEELAVRSGELNKVLFVDGRYNSDVEVLVNGRNMQFLGGLEAHLEDDDAVTLFIHGARGFPGG
jgi:molybdopterin converting factor small subunit